MTPERNALRLINVAFQCAEKSTPANLRRAILAARPLLGDDATDEDVCELLEEIRDFLDNYTDVRDGDDGQPRPNAAMTLHSRVSALLSQSRA